MIGSNGRLPKIHHQRCRSRSRWFSWWESRPRGYRKVQNQFWIPMELSKQYSSNVQNAHPNSLNATFSRSLYLVRMWFALNHRSSLCYLCVIMVGILSWLLVQASLDGDEKRSMANDHSNIGWSDHLSWHKRKLSIFLFKVDRDALLSFLFIQTTQLTFDQFHRRIVKRRRATNDEVIRRPQWLPIIFTSNFFTEHESFSFCSETNRKKKNPKASVLFFSPKVFSDLAHIFSANEQTEFSVQRIHQARISHSAPQYCQWKINQQWIVFV